MVERKYLETGFVGRDGEYTPYGVGDAKMFDQMLELAGTRWVEVCEDPGVCFFLVHHKTKTYADAPKFKTLEAAVAAAIIMGVPE